MPRHQTRRFVCLSDLEDFRTLDRSGGSTSAWYIKPRPGADASDRSTFELVDFTVDGEAMPIRRSAKKAGQTYSVDIGTDRIAAGTPVAVAYTYRAIANDLDRLLQLRVDQPTHGLSVHLDYTDTDIKSLRVVDYIASGRSTRISHTSPTVPERSTTIEFDGWVLANSGVAFTWR